MTPFNIRKRLKALFSTPAEPQEIWTQPEEPKNLWVPEDPQPGYLVLPELDLCDLYNPVEAVEVGPTEGTPEGPVEPDLEAVEEQDSQGESVYPKELFFTLDEIVKELVEEGRRMTTTISEWEPEEEILEQVSQVLPEKEEQISEDNVAELVMEIQKQYVYDRFMPSFKAKLYSLRSDIVNLDESEFFKHYVHMGVISSQVAQVLILGTQMLIAKTYKYMAANKKKQEEQPQVETNETPWLQWGMVAGEG